MPLLNVAFVDEPRSTCRAALHQLAEQLNDVFPLQDFDWNYCRDRDLADIKRLFSSDPNRAEQFLRSALVVALADGHLSQTELDLLQTLGRSAWPQQRTDQQLGSLLHAGDSALDPLQQWLDAFDPGEERISSFIVCLIPSQCPLERDIILFGRKLVHIPPMCKVNPLNEQLVALRFRCLGHLSVDEQLRISYRDSAQV